jgi:hypothetical protein
MEVQIQVRSLKKLEAVHGTPMPNDSCGPLQGNI